MLGTLQAGYTDFKYLGKATKEIVEREALIGVSITGWMNNPDILFNEDVMREGARIVKETNKKVANLIGINQAARCCTVKPSGNASVLLQTASGIHGEHSPYYIRNVQITKSSEVAKAIKEVNPTMVEQSIWNKNETDYCISFPVISPEGSVYKDSLYGVKQLEYVKKAQTVWIEEGTNVELCVHPELRHNVSNTITVDDWGSVSEYIFNNKEHFCGISFLSKGGDKDFQQAPFTEIKMAEDIALEYGNAALYASGLIVAGLDAFSNNLWDACSAVIHNTVDMDDEGHRTLLKRDFIRRFHKFANNWFNGDVRTTSHCLKDVYLLHKWDKLQQSIKNIDWLSSLGRKEYVDVGSLSGQACSGGACEIEF